MSRLTVLMSVHNAEPYLGRAIDSILEQTFTEFEFLIIDDGSTDGSGAHIARRAAEDPRIRPIFGTKRRGLGFRLNQGVREAQGTWIARMDGDDISLPDRLAKQVAFTQSNPGVDVFSGWAIECDADDEPIRIRRTPVRHDDIVRLIWAIPLIHPATMFKRQRILEVGSYDPALPRRQDYDLWFRCASEGLTFANLPEPLIKYRMTSEFYVRNDWRAAWEQVKVGWRGCQLMGATPLTYLWVTAPLVRALMPGVMQRWVHRVMNRLDPRQRENHEGASPLLPDG